MCLCNRHNSSGPSPKRPNLYLLVVRIWWCQSKSGCIGWTSICFILRCAATLRCFQCKFNLQPARDVAN